MKRNLGKFETAAALSGEKAVFNIVGILRLDGVPAADTLRKALDLLQKRHPFLNVRILHEGGKHIFESVPNAPIPLEVLDRSHQNLCTEVAEKYLNQVFDHNQAPLIACSLITDDKLGEIIISMQHSIGDGSSMATLFHDLMKYCAAIESGESLEVQSYPPLAPGETYFPPEFQGGSLKVKQLGYFMSQMADEFKYQLAQIGKRKPPIEELVTQHIVGLDFSEQETSAIVRRARKERVTLNSVLNAAVLLSAQKHLYSGAEGLYRYMSMADLRQYLDPAPPSDQLGGFVGPMRYTIKLNTGENLWPLAQRMNAQIYTALKGGGKFLASVMMEQVMRMAFAMKSIRMTTTGLSYAGHPAIEPSYGPFKVLNLHGFISNFNIGAEFSGRAGLFDDCLIWDMVYLDSDMDVTQAQNIMDEIKTLLTT